MREADIARELESPGSGLYQVQNHGLDYITENNGWVLIYPVDEVQTTLVRLELNADRIQYVRTVAQGKIELVELKK